MAIRIITDSTSDISKREAAQKGIGVAGLTVVIDGVEYTEGEDITYENFYSLAENSTQVLTSQPSPSVFAKLFNEAKRAGDKVIGLFVSSHLSGTYQSACIAAESCEMQDIYLIDTQNISISVRLMVYTALELIKNYYDHADEVNDMIQSKLKNWKANRISRVSSAILRLGTAEMMYSKEDMDSVVINEAVELSKKFAGENDYQFINGVLGAVSKELRGNSQS